MLVYQNVLNTKLMHLIVKHVIMTITYMIMYVRKGLNFLKIVLNITKIKMIAKYLIRNINICLKRMT